MLPAETIINLDDCWALRRSAPHFVDPLNEGLLCPHLKNSIKPLWDKQPVCHSSRAAKPLAYGDLLLSPDDSAQVQPGRLLEPAAFEAVKVTADCLFPEGSLIRPISG